MIIKSYLKYFNFCSLISLLFSLSLPIFNFQFFTGTDICIFSPHNPESLLNAEYLKYLFTRLLMRLYNHLEFNIICHL